MSTVIIEHVKVGDLPEAWRERLAKPSDARVTVRIDEETTRREGEASQLKEGVEDPAFGIWRDRDDLADVDAYLRKIRAPRHGWRHRPSEVFTLVGVVASPPRQR